MLRDEGAVLAEDLQAIVGAVAYVDKTVLVEADAVYGIAELLRERPCRIIGRLFSSLGGLP